MSTSHIIGNRNSTPETSSTSSLRPPQARTIGSGHPVRASADAANFTSSPLVNRGIRPSSEVYYNQAKNQGNGPEDAMEKAAQQWISDIESYESTLEEMATATLDQDFKDELSAIEQWFRVLSEAERTAALYALLQQTTQVQIRFFIQVLQQMAQNLPMSGVLSPSAFGEKDPVSQRFSDALGSKLNIEGSRNSTGMGRPPPSPGAKRNSGLDPSTINSMFPDAAAAIAKQKAEFTQHTGTAPTSNRNSAATDRASLVAPSISAPEGSKKENVAPPASPWAARASNTQSVGDRPKSSQGHQQPMGQFTQPPPSATKSHHRPAPLGPDGSLQNTNLAAGEHGPGSALPVLSPYTGSGNWASMVNTPLVANFNAQQQGQSQADMVANATAMKLAALSTVSNRIQLDDVRKYRRARSSEGNRGAPQNNPLSPGAPGANILMTNELGQVLSPQQAAALQAQQLAALQGSRSRPASPGMAMQGGNAMGGMGFASPQHNGFLSTYDNPQLLGNNLANLNLSNIGGMMQSGEGYLSDADAQRGRSPRGRRATSRPPDDPTDLTLLRDIPAWLRSLRLHKYTDNLKDLKWTELVELGDEGLEKRGVNALGARRKMLKVFEQVKDAQNQGKL